VKDDDATPEQRREAFHDLLQESMQREDFGVGNIWQPSVGDGTRPSSIYAKNVTSLATADMEMDTLGAVAKSHRVSEPVLHFVFSVNPEQSKLYDDATLVGAAERALQKIDLGGNAQIHSVHRDTAHAHVHVAVASVNAETLRSWERQRNYHRLSWAVREVEIEMGLPHDRGLAVVRGAGTPQERIAWADRDELLAWARERTEQRLEDQARKYGHDYAAFESPQSWATDVVAPRLREYLAEAQARSEDPRWSDMHLIAAQSAVRLERNEATGELMVRVMERVNEGGGSQEGRAQKRDEFGEPMQDRERRAREVDTPAIAIPMEDLVGVAPEANARDERAYEQRQSFVEKFVDAPAAEENFIVQIKHDPGLVSREIVNGGEAVFSRADIDRFLGARISDATTLAEVSQIAEMRDGSLRMLSADTEHPLYTTAAQQTLEERVVAKAAALAKERDPGWNQPAMDRAISDFERERGISISEEQRKVLYGLDHRLSWVGGDGGSGKTTLMACANRYAQITERPIVGLTTAQAAAEQLQKQSGAFALNSVRALTYEEHAGKRIVEHNAIVMLDETSMLDISIANELLDLARERNALVIGIGDAAQLPAIGAGDTHRVISAVAKEHGTYSEMHDVRRQRDDLAWMRPIVSDLGRSIREGDQQGVVRNIRTMDEHGVFQFHADREVTLRAAAAAYVEAYTSGRAIILNCDSRLDAKHLNREIRECLGLTGGTGFKTSQGVAQATVGDRIVFLKNNATVGVLNGNTARVDAVKYARDRWTITATLDDGRTVRWNPDRYREWGAGHAVTTHKAQGQSVHSDVYVMTHQVSDVRLAHVGWTRGESTLNVMVSREAYDSAHELAQGLAERTQPKSDAILYRELEKRYGGPNSYWATNVRRASNDLKNPLRLEYQHEQRALTARRDTALRSINTRYQKRSATSPGEKKQLEREHRAATKRVIEAHKPQTFVQWAGTREKVEAIQAEGQRLEAVGEIRQQRDTDREHARTTTTREQQIQRELERTLERTAADRDRTQTRDDRDGPTHTL
jgi:hypothetical protein